MHNQTAHSLNSVNQYNVYRTFAGGVRLAKREFVKSFRSYVAAQDEKRTLRDVRGGAEPTLVSWGVVTAVYADGCESEMEEE